MIPLWDKQSQTLQQALGGHLTVKLWRADQWGRGSPSNTTKPEWKKYLNSPGLDGKMAVPNRCSTFSSSASHVVPYAFCVTDITHKATWHVFVRPVSWQVWCLSYLLVTWSTNDLTLTFFSTWYYPAFTTLHLRLWLKHRMMEVCSFQWAQSPQQGLWVNLTGSHFWKKTLPCYFTYLILVLYTPKSKSHLMTLYSRSWQTSPELIPPKICNLY